MPLVLLSERCHRVLRDSVRHDGARQAICRGTRCNVDGAGVDTRRPYTCSFEYTLPVRGRATPCVCTSELARLPRTTVRQSGHSFAQWVKLIPIF